MRVDADKADALDEGTDTGTIGIASRVVIEPNNAADVQGSIIGLRAFGLVIQNAEGEIV